MTQTRTALTHKQRLLIKRCEYGATTQPFGQCLMGAAPYRYLTRLAAFADDPYPAVLQILKIKRRQLRQTQAAGVKKVQEWPDHARPMVCRRGGIEKACQSVYINRAWQVTRLFRRSQ
ncbi:hypothetical protein HSBAA_64660 [Vreelandella sulfidaeris]|uniref:Uncharacterized protein n=1 Tax=Vreelandella sulfidaeris TaxID=115553 RepID=A0A455UG00_9GAMM|nr:hypothetical protein HSBAA_64660 [Halomonas sulfidaeris]